MVRSEDDIMISIAIVDDHAMVRMGLKYVINLHSEEFSFAGEHPCGTGAGAFVANTKPDILLLDICMPDRDGIKVLEDVLLVRPEQKVIMLTTSEADNDVYRALNMGAKGYLLKDRDSDDLFKAARAVASGGTFVPEAVRELYRQRQMTEDLTPKESEVLEKLAGGLSTDGIADSMLITDNAVKKHLKSIFAKLGVSDRVNAVTEAIRRGFVRR
ncbi:MAG: response regulator transcription factor [Lentisphaerae bacterium]|nr:response regulator transcription factor [Lentisphaerota bacterium]